MKSAITAKDLKYILFGTRFQGKKSRNVFHSCTTLREELGVEIYIAANNLNWLMSTGRLNPPYLLALREGTAQQVCSVVLSLRGIVGESNMIKAVESSTKPVKV